MITQKGPIPGRSAGPDRRTVGRPKTGKSSNPDYATAFFLIRKETKQKLALALAGSNGEMDSSDLVESLLQEWLKKQS
jgi:hypothetical protein